MGTSLLATDGYKFSMAEAGWPLRRETFYAAHRKGGLQVLPFDVATELKKVLPEGTEAEWRFLHDHQYELGTAYRAGVADHAGLTVRALPKFAVFNDREPIFSVTGPSALVSWLEPLVLMWHFRIQVATAALFRPETLAAAVGTVTCGAQKQLVLETLDAVGVPAPAIAVDPDGYRARVRAQVRELAEITQDPKRLFEVGLRAASCMDQHLIALEACRDEGLTRTSNVYGAWKLGLVPVGTMGHEHVQRYGSDEAAFRAMTERRHQRSSFLLDTFDTIASGLPAAFEIIQERRGHGDSIRYDSGDKELQYRHAAKLARELGIRPVQILEDGFDAPQTRRFETLRRELGIEASEQVYGYGGYLVAQTSGSPFTRDRVAAVYKLSQTGKRATMKFANESGSGKQSVPGRPVLFRRRAGASGPFGLVGQDGESTPQGYEPLTGAPALARPDVRAALAVPEADRRLALTPATQTLVEQCTQAAFGRKTA